MNRRRMQKLLDNRDCFDNDYLSATRFMEATRERGIVGFSPSAAARGASRRRACSQ